MTQPFPLSLLHKYDVPTPRYTSYPTVPYWDFTTLTQSIWKKSVVKTFIEEDGALCIYIHLPFCENLCTFCACNKRITKNHEVEEPYIDAVLKEWAMYLAILPSKPMIKEIHLGGGTPTFFRAKNLFQLIKGITTNAIIAPKHEFSVEIHPNYTTEEHIKKLAAAGFNRISIGVQDFDPVVQFAINRVQSFEQTKSVVDWARKYKYRSVNIDLIYGLPHQTVASIAYTIDRIKTLQPDRIAYYSYAHVPWKSKVQRRYTDDDLPAAAEKWAMYQQGRTLLQEAGYESIGMDHFALPNDKLFAAAALGELHRNFMGYTTTTAKLIIGLGVSAISDSWVAFAQNEKVVEDYEDKINKGVFPLINGHILTPEDMVIRKKILELMCNNQTELSGTILEVDVVNNIVENLLPLQEDELVTLTHHTIKVTSKGKLFIRNICAALDAKLEHNQLATKVFSQAI